MRQIKIHPVKAWACNHVSRSYSVSSLWNVGKEGGSGVERSAVQCSGIWFIVTSNKIQLGHFSKSTCLILSWIKCEWKRVHMNNNQGTRNEHEPHLLHFWQLNLDLFKSSDVGTQKTSNGSFMCLIVWLGNCFGGPFSRNITILTECYPDCKDQLPPLILTDWTLNRNRHTNSIPCAIEMTIKLGGGRLRAE